MKRNLVICSDGTGNTFDESVSNVTRLIRLLALDNHETQIVFYDQGIGTNAKRLVDVERYRESIPDKESLILLPGPKEWRFKSSGLLARLLGLVGGYGLKANVREMYGQLIQQYKGPDDNIFLFGFSRGAFTVRVLAGLLNRCGLPDKNVLNGIEKLDTCFEDAWERYKSIREDEVKVADFRQRFRVTDLAIHLLGVWDTVKSYGGVLPRKLPHLRHNPIVRTVRHAMALNERRSWFNATTWGQLDSDERGAKKRLKKKDRSKYESQDIGEVWFRGCHSDIGGVDDEAVTAGIALRWMLNEAHSVGLRLNEEGKCVLGGDDPKGLVEVHESFRWFWWLTEIIPRMEIDNSGEYPKWKPAWGRTGRRNPGDLRRQGHISFHKTVGE